MIIGRKLIQVGLVALGAMSALPASAQYYRRPFYPDQGDYSQQQPDYDYQEQQPTYRRNPGYGARPYYSRRAQLGQACYTSRGTCYLDYATPVGSQCRCIIPGFGKKRGEVVSQ